MDRELIEYFDRRFDESDRRSEERFAALGDRIDETNRRFDERREETNRRFDETNRRFDESDRRNEERFSELRRDMNDGLRQNRVLIEDLTGKMELVIEGVVGFRQELKQDISDVREEIREVQTRLDVSHGLLDRQIKASQAADV